MIIIHPRGKRAEVNKEKFRIQRCKMSVQVFQIRQGDEHLSSHSGLGLIGGLPGKTSINDRVNDISAVKKPSTSNADAVMSMIGLRCLGKPDFDAIEPMRRREPFLAKSLGLKACPSKRNGCDYITLFVDLIQRRTIFIAEGKDHKTLGEFVDDLAAHKGEPEKITDVSCDMSPAFIKGVKEHFPEAKITFDRFHIMKILNKAVDKVRKEEVKVQSLLKGNKYIFLKNKSNLTDKQLKVREELSMPNLNLKSIKALHIRENFQEIYKAETEEEFENLLKRWYFWAAHSRIEPIKKAAYTIKKHWEGILQWKKFRIDNGLPEGLNSFIQAAKAKAGCFRNNRYFKIIAFLVTGKLDFTSFNKCYLAT